MKPLQLIDDFLTPQELKKVSDIIHKVGWEYKGRSSDTSTRFWFADLSKYSLLTDEIFEKIQINLKKKFKLHRVYANGQTYGQDGTFHIDDNRDNIYTFIIYLSDISPTNVDIIGGFTQFKINNSIVNVEPYMNRCIFFKSNIVHRGLAPSRMTDLLRVSIAFKLIDIT
jgi:hypothetical protein